MYRVLYILCIDTIMRGAPFLRFDDKVSNSCGLIKAGSA